ncbi:MAG: exported protein of unknown function [Candidatus Saccharibacteria bacterium]|nr:exported protein of unknown function [Candidatus Saccharibacteria bacterium]
MRTFIKNIKQKFDLRTSSFVVSVLLSIVAIPAAVLAYGPDRPTFTITDPATYVTFDSITNDPSYGDERNFFRVKDVTTGEQYGDTANLKSGDKYEALIFYHNNASSDLNTSGVGIAHGAYARTALPSVIHAGTSSTTAEAYVGATNANPQTVYDYINFSNSGAGDIAIRYVDNSAKIFNNGATNGQAINENALFSSTGTPLGFDSLNGDLPACDHYSGYITFDFTAVAPNFTFVKNVRPTGTGADAWKPNLTVNQGTTVDYKLSYDNTGNTAQNDVTLRDKLPAGVTFIPGSAKLYNGNFPDGKTVDDSISSANGSDIGNYAGSSSADLHFSARIDAAPCTVLTNIATAATVNGELDSSATVTVAGNCAGVLPTTGPAQVIAGLIGLGAITVGVVYFLKSRQELEFAMLHTQSHPLTLSKNDPPTAPDATQVEDVEAEHKHKKSEHKK